MEATLLDIEPLDSRQFVIAVKRLATSLSYGNDRSPFLGSGLEYAQSRPYQFGDPIRSIDWRVTARAGKVFVKEYEAPKRLPCYLLVDTSASMTVSSQSPSKYWMAVHIAGGIAFACLDRASPVGVVGVGGRKLRIEPSLSKTQVMQWFHHLRHYRYDEPTTLGLRIAQLVPRLSGTSLVIVLSDLHDPWAVPALKQLSEKHDVAVLQLQDPAERGVRRAGFVRAGEAETGKQFATRSSRHWVSHHQAAQQLKRSGIDHLVLPTDRPFVHHLRNFFRARDLLGRGAR
ncbi:DUF58 domain-containing protein [Aeoliella sp. ICT_H6.2]|uniref:DUF58 domain-containing protein n=1 Tax=Aeoliella straminimaris TaxID=2954799 RepID=A0A9X2FAZ1_9BACT|nr:DUF58 domain-containing protein [Aeoliella straminimaris]MCO6044873.1 DUF58 domain-containing protein [Aeoliella straminimaris]